MAMRTGSKMINERTLYATPEQIQEMIQKREVAIDLLSDGAVRRKLLAELRELRSSGTRLRKGRGLS
jgi:hypothetical protein